MKSQAHSLENVCPASNKFDFKERVRSKHGQYVKTVQKGCFDQLISLLPSHSSMPLMLIWAKSTF